MTVDSMYMDNLEEYVVDENKVVTYKWLSRTLQVHVNVAKQMLYNFVQVQRNEKENTKLTVTYFVSGFKHSDNTSEMTVVVQIVPEETLEPFKSTLSSLASCHIYSVQQSKLKDTGALYTADYELQKENFLCSNLYSAIKCATSVPRSSADLLKLRSKAQPTNAAPTFAKDAQNGSGAKSLSNPQKPSSVAGMFAKAATTKKPDQPNSSAQEQDKKTEKSSGKDTSGISIGKAKQGGLASFFNKQGSKPKEVENKPVIDEKNSTAEEKKSVVEEKKVEGKKPVVEERKKPVSEEKKVEASEVEQKHVKVETISKKGNNKTEKHVSTTKPERSRKQKLDSDEEDESGTRKQKKRRRIQEKMWDSSSEEEEEEEDMDIVPPTPPPGPVSEESSPSPPAREPSPSAEPTQGIRTGAGGKRRIRKRRMVSKHTVTDDGYMQTEKVWEDYSTDASEGVEEVPSKNNSTDKAKANSSSGKDKRKSPPKKKASPKNNKQASLTSFFKKK